MIKRNCLLIVCVLTASIVQPWITTVVGEFTKEFESFKSDAEGQLAGKNVCKLGLKIPPKITCQPLTNLTNNADSSGYVLLETKCTNNEVKPEVNEIYFAMKCSVEEKCKWMNWTNWDTCRPNNRRCDQWYAARKTKPNCVCSDGINLFINESRCITSYHIQSCNNPKVTCDEYWDSKWSNITQWSTCKREDVNNSTLNCSEFGYQVGTPEKCFNYTTSNEVDVNNCGERNRSCIRPCEDNCTYSIWSAWGECVLPKNNKNRECGYGYETRTKNTCICGLYNEVHVDTMCGVHPIEVRGCGKVCKEVCQTTERKTFSRVVSNEVLNIKNHTRVLIKNIQSSENSYEVSNDNSCFKNITNAGKRNATSYEYIPPVSAVFIKVRDGINDDITITFCGMPSYGQWTEFSNCSWENCAKYGIRNRTRICYSDSEKTGVIDPIHCVGKSVEQNQCEVKCVSFSDWSSWSECNYGQQHRDRECSNGTCIDSNLREQSNCSYVEYKLKMDWSDWEVFNVTNVRQSFQKEKQCYEIFSSYNQTNNNTCITTSSSEMHKTWFNATRKDNCFTSVKAMPFTYCNGTSNKTLILSHWSDWKNCQNGRQERTRQCDNDTCEDLLLKEEQACQITEPIWSNWTTSGCNVTCGGGKLIYSRTCEVGNCTGDELNITDCNTNLCAVDGNWTMWNDWLPCSVSCGIGSRVRFRECSNPRPSFNGKDCTGSNKYTMPCNEINCTDDLLKIKTWAEWSECSVPCGSGNRSRTKVCDSTASCTIVERVEQQNERCFKQFCPKDGEWGEWQPWQQCSGTCGFNNTSKRVRYCKPPINGGRNCDRPSEDFKQCNTRLCPVNGGWSSWSTWTFCETPCSGGMQEKRRKCNNPVAELNGAPCIGDAIKKQSCSQSNCTHTTVNLEVKFTKETFYPAYVNDEISVNHFKEKLITNMRKVLKEKVKFRVDIHSLSKCDGDCLSSISKRKN